MSLLISMPEDLDDIAYGDLWWDDGVTAGKTNRAGKLRNVHPRLPEPFFCNTSTPFLDFRCKASDSYDFGTGVSAFH